MVATTKCLVSGVVAAISNTVGVDLHTVAGDIVAPDHITSRGLNGIRLVERTLARGARDQTLDGFGALLVNNLLRITLQEDTRIIRTLHQPRTSNHLHQLRVHGATGTVVSKSAAIGHTGWAHTSRILL